MTDVPRRAEPSGADKVAVIADRAAPGALAGNTQWHRPQSVKQPTAQSAGAVIVGDTSGLDDAIAITATIGSGDGSTASANNAIAIGSDGYPDAGPVASGGDSIAIGRKSAATVGEAIAIGKAATSVGFGTVAIGGGANADGGPDPGNLGTIAIGSGANAVGTANIAIGSDSEAIGAAMALGAGAKAYGNALAIVGEVGTPTVPVDNAVAIGHDAHATADHDFILGSFLHHVIVNGALIIADNTGGLHQIVVDTSGVLSTVTYP